MTTPVKNYAAAWNPGTNKGQFYIYLENNSNPLPLNPDSPEEFIALMLMLSKGNLQWDDTKKQFELPERPVGS